MRAHDQQEQARLLQEELPSLPPSVRPSAQQMVELAQATHCAWAHLVAGPLW